MAEDIKAIDIMNYTFYISPEERREIFAHPEFMAMWGTVYPGLKTVEDAVNAMGLPSLDALLKDMDEAGYEKVILTAMKQWSYRSTFSHLIECSLELTHECVEKGNGRVVGGVSYNPYRIKESIQDIDRAIKEYGFKYIYFHPASYNFNASDRKWYPAYAKALEYGVPIGFQSGLSAEWLPSETGNPMYLEEAAFDFPDVTIIMSHSGYPWVSEWMHLIEKFPNVYGDISSYPPRALPELDRFVDFMARRGRRKVMFGTNILGLKRCKEQFMELPLKDAVKEEVLRGTAIKVFKL